MHEKSSLPSRVISSLSDCPAHAQSVGARHKRLARSVRAEGASTIARRLATASSKVGSHNLCVNHGPLVRFWRGSRGYIMRFVDDDDGFVADRDRQPRTGAGGRGHQLPDDRSPRFQRAASPTFVVDREGGTKASRRRRENEARLKKKRQNRPEKAEFRHGWKAASGSSQQQRWLCKQEQNAHSMSGHRIFLRSHIGEFTHACAPSYSI